MMGGLASAAAIAMWVWPDSPARRLGGERRTPVGAWSAIGRWADLAVARADLGAVIGDPLRAWALVVPLGALVGFGLDGLRAATVGAVVGAILAPLAVWMRRNALAARIEAELPAYLERLARQVGSGLALGQCLAAAEGSILPLAEVGAAVRRGVSLVDALHRWAEKLDSDPARFTAAVLAMSHTGGAAQAHALHAVARALRDRRQAVLDARALAAQSRVSAMVLVGLPVGVAALVVAADPDARQFYGSSVGMGLSGLGLALDLAGLAWMRRLGRSPS